MAYSYRDILFNLFGKPYKLRDVNKDANGKGTFERYNECIGKDIDDELKPLIDNLLFNFVSPQSIKSDFIQYAESDLGVDLFLDVTAAKRRSVLKEIENYKQIKGTKKCVRLLFSLLRVNCGITEIFSPNYTFDSVITLDDPDRTFDGGCAGCSRTTLTLTGSAPLTQTLKNGFASIINYNIPYNLILSSVSYNGTPLVVIAPTKSNDYKYQIR